MYRELIRADESWREPLAKYKTPNDFVISTFRALDHVPDNLQQITAFLNELGQRPFTPGSPAGWPDTAASWNGGDALLKRIEWAAPSAGASATWPASRSSRPGRRVGAGTGRRRDTRRHSRRCGRWSSARAADLVARVPTAMTRARTASSETTDGPPNLAPHLRAARAARAVRADRARAAERRRAVRDRDPARRARRARGRRAVRRLSIQELARLARARLSWHDRRRLEARRAVRLAPVAHEPARDVSGEGARDAARRRDAVS